MKFEVQEIEVKDILCDSEFNCRGYVNPMMCFDLAQDIKENGLDTPISVWANQNKKKPDFRWQILAGHRRYTAYIINEQKTIPCYVRTDITNMFDALAMNIRENIQRSDLTLAQESRRVGQLMLTGRSAAQVATALGKTTAWIEPRRKLMEMPTEVIEAAEKDILNQGHIALLYTYKNNPEKLREVLLQIKQRYESGEKGIQVRKDVTVGDLTKTRRPKSGEVSQFREMVGENITFKIGEPYFPHQVLSWMLGDLSLVKIYRAYAAECVRLELEPNIPKEIVTLMAFVPDDED